MLRTVGIVIAVALLAGCAEFDNFMENIEQLPPGTTLQKAKRTTPEADAHNMQLYSGYIGLSQAEYDEGDYRDSDYFADRAIASAGNIKVDPQEISARDLGVDALNDAAIARRKLTVLYYKGARELYPVEVADAQVAYDCWLQETEEGFQFDDIAACKRRFETAMTQIQEKERLAEAARLAAAAARARTTEPLVFEVFFDFDSDGLSDSAKTHVAVIARTIMEFRNPVVSVFGNADQVGAVNYNVALSQRRAEAVTAILRNNGVEPDAVVARGDQVPALDLINRAAERRNRSVIITVREEG